MWTELLRPERERQEAEFTIGSSFRIFFSGWLFGLKSLSSGVCRKAAVGMRTGVGEEKSSWGGFWQ